ncbi:MAG TPA: hypothetical protein VGS19_29055 [Streptosporangiaceae bacterium]|nr:hypothetical protein [Streptosporangiaceae bacterium]
MSAENWERHHTHIGHRRITQANSADGEMPFARCTCGWEGPGRLGKPDAIKDADAHLAAVTP